MTIWDLLATAWRRRLVVLACALASGLLLYGVAAPVVAYNGRVTVLLLVPQGTPGNALSTTTQSLIGMAGVAARAATGPHDAPQTVSADITLASMGVERGWSLRQPNAGGQWEIRYEDPLLDVQSTGRTLEEAQATMQEALDHVRAALTELEDRADVPATARIRTELSPQEPAFTVQTGSRVRALALTAVICAIGTGAAVLAADGLASRRARRRSLVAHPS